MQQARGQGNESRFTNDSEILALGTTRLVWLVIYRFAR